MATAVAIANRQRLVPLGRPVRETLRRLCRCILAEHNCQADLSLTYVDDAPIRALNLRYLGRDEVTDVLAFPLDDAGGTGVGGTGVSPVTPGDRLLGEIVVSTETARSEARRRRIPVARELALYTAHGLLHLLGNDDHTPAERRARRRAERRALAAAGRPGARE